MVAAVENDGSITDILATSLRITIANAGEPEKPVRGQHSHGRSQSGAGGYQQKETHNGRIKSNQEWRKRIMYKLKLSIILCFITLAAGTFTTTFSQAKSTNLPSPVKVRVKSHQEKRLKLT